MTRTEAEAVLKPHIESISNRYVGVGIDAVRQLLGEIRFHRLQHDRIRNQGPCTGMVYPWNVVDYLVNPELNAKKTPLYSRLANLAATQVSRHGPTDLATHVR